jgi:hypothetical protein
MAWGLSQVAVKITIASIICQIFSRSGLGLFGLLVFMTSSLLIEQAKPTKLLWGNVFRLLRESVQLLYKSAQLLIFWLN